MKQLDMTSGRLLPKILSFSAAIMLTNVMQLMFNTADLIVAGRYASENALGAVGAASPVINLFINLFIGLSVGVSVACSHAFGSGDKKGMSDTLSTAYALSIIVGVAFTVIGLVISRPMLVMMGTPDDLMPMAQSYLMIYFLAMPASIFYNCISAAMRAVGNTRDPMVYLVISGFVNVVLNLFFVIAVGMDVDGVAVASVISQYLSAALLLLNVLHTDAAYKLPSLKPKVVRNKLLLILRVGVPTSIHGSLFAISNILLQSALNSFSSIAITGSSAAANIEAYVYQVQASMYQASINFTGQNYGAGKYKNIPKIMHICFTCTIIGGLAAGALACAFGENLLGFYIPASETSAEAIGYGFVRLSMICMLYFLDGIMEIITGTLRGIGCSMGPTVLSVAGVCGVRAVWIFTVFRASHTLKTLYLSYPVSWTISIAALVVMFIIEYRKLLQKSANKANS